MTAHTVTAIQRDTLATYQELTPEVRYSLSKGEAAAAVGMSVDTIDRMIERGDLVAHKFGPRTVRITLDSLANAHRVIPTVGSINAGLV